MSDWIEVDGKKYYEESYLLLANKNAKRRAPQKIMPKLTREQVYQLIDGEREYQKQVEADPSRCNQDIIETPHSSGEYYTMMMAYINKFPEVWCYNPDGDPKILELFRKIGGICVHAMEDLGAPARKLDD